jgi:UDP-N-acetylmuramoyl-tripeptide--D-alanyl-D-alanine ligase
MYELGKDEEALHKSVAEIVKPPLTHLVTIGDRGAWIAKGLHEIGGDEALEVHAYPTKAAAQPYLESLLNDKTVMLFKASRLLALEELSGSLCAKESTNQ